MIRALFIILTTAFSLPLLGQDKIVVAGKIVYDGQDIPGATVSVGTHGDITDENGKFSFTIPPTERTIIEINVSALGFATQSYDLNPDDMNQLELSLHLYPNVTSQTANEDIANGTIQFLLSGGLVPVIYASDFEFEKKYGVSFYEYGCEAISDKSLESYNTVVAKYLDEKFGTQWREEVRPDIKGVNY